MKRSVDKLIRNLNIYAAAFLDWAQQINGWLIRQSQGNTQQMVSFKDSKSWSFVNSEFMVLINYHNQKDSSKSNKITSCVHVREFTAPDISKQKQTVDSVARLKLRLEACKRTFHICTVTPALARFVATARDLDLSPSLPFMFSGLFCNFFVASLLVPRLWRWNRPHPPLQLSSSVVLASP